MAKLNKENRERQIDGLVREVRQLRAQITKSAAPVSKRIRDALLDQTKSVMGGFGIITDLYYDGPKTMPQLLEDRAYSRQHLHDLVSKLEAEGLVEYHENPHHKRSKLIAATEKGIDEMLERRQMVMDTIVPLSTDVTEKEFKTAIKVLRSMRIAFKALRDEQ